MSDRKGSVFISYRRDGGIDIARVLYGQLTNRGYDVFLDMESLRAGTFNTELLRYIESYDNFVLVLSPGCLDRCVNKGDWVRKEIAWALKSGVNIVPVKSADFSFPEKLPEDIDAIRFHNAPILNHEYFNAFVDKLESFLVKEDDSERKMLPEQQSESGKRQAIPKEKGQSKKQIAKKQTTKKQSKKTPDKKVLGAIVVAVIAVVVLLGYAIFGRNQEALVNIADLQKYGNTSGNLCNNGIASISGSTSDETVNISYINKVGDYVYWYNTDKQSVYIKKEESSEVLLKLKDVGYLLVTEEWFYYTIKTGDSTLYRAPRLEEGEQIGEAEELLSGISKSNHMIVEEEIVYFWKEGTGLYSYDLNTKKEKSLLEIDATWNNDLIGKYGDWIYGCDEQNLWRIHVGSGKLEELLQVNETFADSIITGGNVYGSWVYMLISDAQNNDIKHADSIYRMHVDSSELSRIFVAEATNHTIKNMCIYGDEKMFIAVESGNENCAYKLNMYDGEIIGTEPDEFEGFVQRFETENGNSVNNFCNGAFVAYKDPTVYTRRDGALYYNRLGEDRGYVYQPEQRNISLSYTVVDEETDKKVGKSVVLLENVDCSYLNVTADWIYYVAKEGGIYNLYRAENKPEENSIGESELFISDIAGQNGVAINNGWIYYGKEGGLYRTSVDGRNNQFIKETKGSNEDCRIFDVDDTDLYYISGQKIWQLTMAEDKGVCQYDGINDFAGGTIAGVVKQGEQTFLLVHYLDKGVRTKADEIWYLKNTGEISLLHTADSIDVHIEYINIARSKCYMYVKNNNTLQGWTFPLDGEMKVEQEW